MNKKMLTFDELLVELNEVLEATEKNRRKKEFEFIEKVEQRLSDSKVTNIMQAMFVQLLLITERYVSYKIDDPQIALEVQRVFKDITKATLEDFERVLQQ